MNLIFTGFMGSGKTAVGKIVAEKLGRAFFDTDAMVEASSGQSIREIFQNLGEGAFRRMESEAVALAASMENAVISCGGGAVINKKNIDALRKNGIIINLFASPERLFERISEDDKRPLIAGASDPMDEIKKMLGLRGSAYKDCDFSFNTEELSAAQCAEKILENENIRKLIKRGAR